MALKLDPNDLSALVLRGNLLDLLKRYNEALESYNLALDLDANYLPAWTSLGDLLKNLKCYDEALISYDMALELDANDQRAWVDRGNILDNLKRYDEALESYDMALELDTNDRRAWAERGDLLNNLKRYDEALESYDRVLELDENDMLGKLVWGNRGYVLLNLGRLDEALASFDRAVEVDDNDDLAWIVRGIRLQSQGRFDEALEYFDRAIELGLGEQYSSVFFNRAIAILGLNRWDEGIAALDDAFQRLEPGKEAASEDAELIISNLFTNTHDLAISQTRITSLIAVYEKHKYLSILGQGIVRNIPALMSEMVSDKAARTWLELWQESTSNYEQFQIPMRLLNAAVRYKETKGDRRVLLELPIEERDRKSVV